MDGTRVYGGTHDTRGFSLAITVAAATGFGPWPVLHALDLDDRGALLGAGWAPAYRRVGDVSRCERAWCAFVKDAHFAWWSAFQRLAVDASAVDGSGATYGAFTPAYEGEWPSVARASASGAHVWFVVGSPEPRIFRMNSETGELDDLGPIALETGARIWDGALAFESEERAALVLTIERADATRENRFLRAAVGVGVADEILLPDAPGEPFLYFLGDRWAIGYGGMLDEILCP